MNEVYSFADTTVVFNHPKVGRRVLSAEGMGKIGLSYSNDMSSHTSTSNGYVVINKMRSRNGSCAIEVPQNSESDKFLQKYINYIEKAAASDFAEATITINDSSSQTIYTCTGVTPQKRPDRTWDKESASMSYPFLIGDIATT